MPGSGVQEAGTRVTKGGRRGSWEPSFRPQRGQRDTEIGRSDESKREIDRWIDSEIN